MVLYGDTTHVVNAVVKVHHSRDESRGGAEKSKQLAVLLIDAFPENVSVPGAKVVERTAHPKTTPLKNPVVAC